MKSGYGLAANTGPSQGRELHDEAKKRGEESQFDPNEEY